MKAIIVAGGKGERLRPLTDNMPKPMVQILGKPILLYTLELLKKNGITDLIIALCYKPEKIIEYFGDGNKFGVNIQYTFESPDLPLGTAGAIWPAKEYINETFIVTYADIIRNLDIREMINFHKKSSNLATINTYKHSGENYKSSLLFNDKNQLIDFIELNKSENLKNGSVWSNGSFYIFEPKIFDYINKNKANDFSRDVFPLLLKSKEGISVFPSNDLFIDVGTFETLMKAEVLLKKINF